MLLKGCTITFGILRGQEKERENSISWHTACARELAKKWVIVRRWAIDNTG